MIKELENILEAEVYEKRIYEVFSQKYGHLEINILDRGEDHNDNTRYQCHVKNLDTGKTAAGNNASSAEQAINNVHWYNLN